MESRISVPEIASEAQQKQRYERLRAAVSALPGVESVALAKELPLMLGYNETPAQVRDNDKQIPVAQTVVDADYFATFGIRVALGAGRWELLKMILRQTLRITGAGVAIGILLGVGVTIGLRSQFYGISPVEWMVLVPVGARCWLSHCSWRISRPDRGSQSIRWKPCVTPEEIPLLGKLMVLDTGVSDIPLFGQGGGRCAIKKILRSHLFDGAVGVVGPISEQIFAEVEPTTPAAPLKGRLRRYLLDGASTPP